ncbi:MAG: hypothetical protein ACM3WU_11780 [Bacillota bacterium]
MRKEIPFIISLLVAIWRFSLESFDYLYNYKLATGDLLRNASAYANTFVLCGAMFLGALNLLRIHGNNIRKKRQNWPFSVYLLALMLFQIVVGLSTSHTNPTYTWLYRAAQVPLDATMFSLLAFYIASAAYRAFRVRNVDAAVMLAVAFIVMLGNVSIGQAIWGSKALFGGFEGIKNWILRVPNAAGNRALTLGIFLGLMATQSRILLGIERRHFGQE